MSQACLLPNPGLLFRSELLSITVGAFLYEAGLDQSLTPRSPSYCPHPPTHSPSVQFSSVAQLCPTLCDPWIAARQASLSITNSRSSLRLASIKSSSHLILCRPLLLLPPSPPSISLFQWINSLHDVAKVLEGVSALASFLQKNTQGWCPSEWTGWISLQSKGLSRVFSNTIVQKALTLWHSAFFTVQLSHPYITTGKTIGLTRRTFVGKVMSLLFNMPSRLVTICSVFGAPKHKVYHCFHCFSVYLPWSDGTRCHDFHFLNVEL